MNFCAGTTRKVIYSLSVKRNSNYLLLVINFLSRRHRFAKIIFWSYFHNERPGKNDTFEKEPICRGIVLLFIKQPVVSYLKVEFKYSAIISTFNFNIYVPYSRVHSHQQQLFLLLHFSPISSHGYYQNLIHTMSNGRQ